MRIGSGEARQLLGIEGPLTPQDVRQAFRQRARQIHPDTVGSVDERGDVGRLRAARDALLGRQDSGVARVEEWLARASDGSSGPRRRTRPLVGVYRIDPRPTERVLDVLA